MKGITVEEAVEILSINDSEKLDEIFSRACELRKKLYGNKVSACSVVNARCGGCEEDCSFCAQSSHSDAKVDYYPLISEDQMVASGKKAELDNAGRVGIVTSGRSVTPGVELDAICNAVKRITEESSVLPCASLGLLSVEVLQRLKDVGLKRYHHNLETALSNFAEICGTRIYQDQIDTINNAKSVGLEVCCGGIFGLGETNEQRVELLETIRTLDIDSVPLNFLHPIPGTKLEKMNDLTSLECLKIIAIARLMMPEKTIRVCGGREYNLQDMQGEIFNAGANGLMIGGYLVTTGATVDQDKAMIEEAGMAL